MLTEKYPEKRIHVYVPPHVGQNTSQVANRMEDYLVCAIVAFRYGMHH